MKGLDAKVFEGAESVVNSLHWGDTLTHTRKRPAPVWTSAPDPTWQRYAEWLRTTDRRTQLRHVRRWTFILQRAIDLGDLPVLGRAPHTELDRIVRTMTEPLLKEIEALQLESHGTVSTPESIH
jgi:hypothetical protein